MKYPDVYDNSRRFLVSNWSAEDFTGLWAGIEHVIPAGETKEYEMHLAYHFTKGIVDREMHRAGKDNLLGVEEERAPFEQKTLSELSAGADSPALSALKEKIRAEVIATQEEAKGKVTKKKTEIVEEKEVEFEGVN